VRLAAGETVRTSTPSPGAYLAAFRTCTAPVVVCLTMARQLSAMHQAATVAASLLEEGGDGRRVLIVDTGTAAAGLAVVARAAELLLREGVPVAELEARLRQAERDVVLIGALRTLKYVARSGRVPAVAAYAGGLLRVRPIFEMRHGEVVRRTMARGDGRVTEALRQAAVRSRRADPDHPLWLVVCHAAAPDAAAEVRQALAAVLPVGRAETLALSPVMGAWTGPGMVGFALLPLVGRELAVD
jgi:DegV family protein with EDD domain